MLSRHVLSRLKQCWHCHRQLLCVRWNSSSSSSSEPQYYERGIHPLIGPLSDGAVADDDGSDNNALRSDRYFVTTPIFYVNAKPHVGHMYVWVANVACAAVARVLTAGHGGVVVVVS